MRLIDGLAVPEQKKLMLEKMLDSDYNLEDILTALQQLDLINSYNSPDAGTCDSGIQNIPVHSAATIDKNHQKKARVAKCSYCCLSHQRKMYCFWKNM